MGRSSRLRATNGPTPERHQRSHERGRRRTAQCAVLLFSSLHQASRASRRAVVHRVLRSRARGVPAIRVMKRSGRAARPTALPSPPPAAATHDETFVRFTLRSGAWHGDSGFSPGDAADCSPVRTAAPQVTETSPSQVQDNAAATTTAELARHAEPSARRWLRNGPRPDRTTRDSA